MSATIVWSIASRTDRRNIYSFIEADSPAAAASTDERILECVGQLTRFPSIGRPGRIRGTRELVNTGTSYIVVYRTNGREVRLLRIRHGKQRWPLSFGP